MSDLRCWGVYRELAHSPGRETDDAEILRATARELTSRGFEVELKSPDELADVREGGGGEPPPNMFVMCERPRVVEKLSAWERRGARVVNRPAGIRNTDRERTIALFDRHRVPFPHSVLVDTRSEAAPASPVFRGPCWIKRGDVHATEEGDVSFAEEPSALEAGLARLAGRGIARAVVQDHVPGDLIKFYGVSAISEEDSRPSWFQWFYHRDQVLANHPFDAEALAAAAARAAGALSLDVYGGDAIVSPSGSISIIDLNAWPSFALFRELAASRIAALLVSRFSRQQVLR